MNPYIQYMYSYPHKTAYGVLSGIRLEDYAKRLVAGDNSLYFHIPFCQSKCGYCNLFSVTGQSEAFMKEYVDAMERQAQQVARIFPESVQFSDLTLGGGTPLSLPTGQLERVFEIAEKIMGFDAGDKMIIVETSPGQTTEEKLRLLKEHSVTRISMGVQSFQEEELRRLNRSHSVAQVEQAMTWIRRMGFPCVNLDLIYGIPGQTIESLLASAKRVLEYEPEELFVYPLYIKKDTYLSGKKLNRSEYTYEMYLQIRDYLKDRGYVPCSMRRFVRGGSPSDTGSCGFDNTISLGCGGRSYIGNLHFCTPYGVRQSQCMSILREYMEQQNYLDITHGYLLSEDEEKRRYVIKNILFSSGLSLEEYGQVYGSRPEEDYPILADWIRDGYAFVNHMRMYLTEKGISLSDYLGPMLISKEVREKMCRSEISPLSIIDEEGKEGRI